MYTKHACQHIDMVADAKTVALKETTYAATWMFIEWYIYLWLDTAFVNVVGRNGASVMVDGISV